MLCNFEPNQSVKLKIKYFLFLLITLTSCKDDIFSKKFRNENYVFYQENGKAGKWLKINPDLEIKLPKSHSTYFFPNGNRYAELEIIDSFPNRIIRYFDKENDNLVRTCTYKSDLLKSEVFENGYYRQYHSNLGFLQSEGLIENQMFQGKWKFYRKDGETIKQIVEYVNDTLHGIREDYWENGTLKSKTTNINGKQNGKTYHYHENGETEEINFLKDGKVHGLSTRYYPNGKLESKCTYWLDLRRDTCEFYYKNGNLEKLEIIKLDTTTSLSSGIVYRYYESGELEKVLESENNQVNGKAKLYYKNGNIAQEFDVVNNIKSGKVDVYYETGDLNYTGFAKNNLLDGEIKYFDKKGKLIKTVIGKNGIAIDSTMH
jgi:antitoxin component YwqK of YwqJK toxin-antitoxin module